LKKIRVLGKGSFGTVTLFEDPATHDMIALKAFDRCDDATDDMTQLFIREIEAMIRLRHPCVVAIVGYSLATKISPAQIGTRYAANGSLRQAVDKWMPALDETGKAIVTAGVVLGMKFIHSQGFVHRDLKPENILLDERGFAQIGDIGSSRSFDAGLTLTTQVGTPLYTALEMYDERDYTPAVDVDSFALILYELEVGEPAFPPAIRRNVLIRKVVMGQRPPLPADIGATIRKIIGRAWSISPTRRPLFDEIFPALESIEFKLSPGVDCVRVHEFMSLVGSRSEASGADVLRGRRRAKTAEEGLSKFLSADWELPVSRREFLYVFERRETMQKVKHLLGLKKADEALAPPDGLIAHLTQECGGNVADHGVVRVEESSVRRSDAEFAAKNAADLGSDSVFYSGSGPGQWVCYDFGDMVVIPTHYAIWAAGEMSPWNWVVEGRKCDAE
jgi:serine/threonine protein kinase